MQDPQTAYDVSGDSTALKVIEDNRMYTNHHVLLTYMGLYHYNGGLPAGPIPFHKGMDYVNWYIVLNISIKLQAIPFLREKTRTDRGIMVEKITLEQMLNSTELLQIIYTPFVSYLHHLD